MSQAVLKTSLGGGLVQLALNVPERANALGSGLVDAIAAALEEAASPDTRVVALTSTGSAFCAGFDLDEPLDDASAARRFSAIYGVLERLRTAPFVTVACVDGAAFGAGADLVAACDYRLATDRARFRFPGARFGMVIGVHRLAAITSPDTARDLILRARVVDASDAHSAGLVTNVLDRSQMEAFPAELAADVAEIDEIAMRAVLAATREQVTSASDASLLIGSATRPGLAERISRYAETARERSRTR